MKKFLALVLSLCMVFSLAAVASAAEIDADGPTKQYAGRVTTSYGIYEALLYPNESAEAAGAADGDSMSARAVRAGVANQ